MAAHAYLKNEFTEDKKCQNLMSWFKYCREINQIHSTTVAVYAEDADAYLSSIVTKPTKWHVRPAKTQISLGIRPD